MFKLAFLYKVACYSTNLRHLPLVKPCLIPKSTLELQSLRSYAKGKDKKKEDKGKGTKKNIQINEGFLAEVINLDKMKTEMDNNIQQLSESYIKYVTVRTSIGSVENVSVHFDGRKHSLIELGQIVRKNPKVVAINMAAFPQAIPATLKALSESGMNLNPQQDGTTIFVPVPKLTREHRENLSKNAKAHFIKCRDGIRDVQNKFLKSIKLKKTDGDLSEDISHRASDQVKSIGDSYIANAQKILEAKQEELLGKKEEN